MNKVILIGRLTKDPELKFTPGNGTAVTTLTLAIDRKFSKDGQKEADFIPVVIWGKQAESTANYMSKGKLIGVSGRIQVRNYVAKDGTKRYVTEVIADEVQFLEWGGAKNSEHDGGSFEHEGNHNNTEFESNSDVTPLDDGETPF